MCFIIIQDGFSNPEEGLEQEPPELPPEGEYAPEGEYEYDEDEQEEY